MAKKINLANIQNPAELLINNNKTDAEPQQKKNTRPIKNNGISRQAHGKEYATDLQRGTTQAPVIKLERQERRAERMQIAITKTTAERLAELSNITGISKNELVNRALDTYLNQIHIGQ